MRYQQIEKSRILIVDDIPNNIKIIGTILKEEGYQINIAKNGLEALKVVAREEPDLILLDVMMPEMGGFETCKKLKSQSDTENIPIIFLTARADTDDIVKGFNYGAVDYITKPFNATELLARIKNHLEFQNNKKIIEKQARERQELVHILCHDLANPLNFIVSTLDTIGESQDLFKELSPQLACGANNGLHLIELVRNMEALDDKGIELEKVNLQNAVNESTDILQNQIQAKQLSVEKNIPAHIQILAERTSLINSVLGNIITNAIKFSYPENQILIKTEFENERVCLIIRDYGIGIATDVREDLFDITKSTSTLGTLEECGTGFGMPLVKKFIEAYDGSIKVRSFTEDTKTEKQGTEIRIEFKKG